MQIPTQSPELTKKYFESLPEDDINRKYYKGLKYESPKFWLRKFLNTFKVEEKIDTLEKFYPYQKALEDTRNEYRK